MINVSSEVGTLRRVLLHRPGAEIERLTPRYLEEMLFEDIPWLRKLQEEHDRFAETLRSRGCTVYYYESLLEEILGASPIRSNLIEEILSSARIGSEDLRGEIRAFLADRTPAELAGFAIAGLEKSVLERADRLSSYITETYPFHIDPLTNLYFTRDPGAVIGSRLAISAMKTNARRRESLLLSFIHRYHPLFADTQLWYTPEDIDPIEGGDILVVSPETIIVGCSARTSAEGIERLAQRLFSESPTFREVLVLHIPFVRTYMHLDTVLNMVDRDAFLVFPGVRERIEVFRLTPAIEREKNLEKALSRALRVDTVRLIESGGTDDLTAAREQWNDGTNTLALEPGVVIAYDRNVTSNEALRAAGIEVIEIAGSELVRGRGGPRCMSMPLERCPLNL